MAHQLSIRENGFAEMAYLKSGGLPWHHLGQPIEDNQPIEVWEEKSGLIWGVNESPVMYRTAHGTHTSARYKMLSRSDSGEELGVVGVKYKTIQPYEVTRFFERLIKEAGFKLEVMGALQGGRRVWCQARIAEDFKIYGDVQRPFATFSTSYTTEHATWARTCITRTVCNNTVMRALAEKGTVVRIPHSADFDREAVRMQMGLLLNEYERFKVEAMKLADREIRSEEAATFVRNLMGLDEDQAAASRGFKRIMSLFDGNQIGAEGRSTKNTLFGLVQAITEHVDHNPYARNSDTRMATAMFGQGAELKAKAYTQALELVA